MNNLVYAVILNYNGYEDTKKCILSLTQVGYNNLEIIVVDNCSPDRSGEILSKEFSSIKFIYSNENKGYAYGMNLGIQYSLKSGADYILLTNNDVTFTFGFIDPLLKVLNSGNHIGVVSPKVLYMNNPSIIYCAGADFSILWGGGYNPYQGKLGKDFGNNMRKITFAEGSCLLSRKEVFEEIGLISEKYFMYFEDLDFSREVIKKFEIWYVPGSIIYHKAGAGKTWSSFSSLYYYYYTRNRLIFFSKYNFFIRAYGILFSLFNSIAKTIILIMAYIRIDEKRRITSSIRSLWNGFNAGLKYIFIGN